MAALLRSLFVASALALTTGGLALSSAVDVAAAAETKGRPVTIRVVDQFGMPIVNARVRVPGTEGKTLVDGNGEWTESMLYTVEGDEFVFKKKDFIEFNISAPKYYARAVRYEVKGNMNYVEVALRAMPEPTAPLTTQDDRDMLIRWFQRTEVEEAPQGPENKDE